MPLPRAHYHRCRDVQCRTRSMGEDCPGASEPRRKSGGRDSGGNGGTPRKSEEFRGHSFTCLCASAPPSAPTATHLLCPRISPAKASSTCPHGGFLGTFFVPYKYPANPPSFFTQPNQKCLISTNWLFLPSVCCLSTLSRRLTPATQVLPWVWLLLPTLCGRR